MRLLRFGQKSRGWSRVQAVLALVTGMSSFEIGAAMAKIFLAHFPPSRW
ncbi:hypothetical protein DOFOFD_11935 [Acetobacteraceae bacterium EV16P]|uniref:Uncharacterized protein n=1 Tax=Sorlinia euscelidii TaxID=3081148 RepID=A0ABU7U4E5_9PROT